MQTNALNSAILEFSKNSEGQISPLLQEFLTQQSSFCYIIGISCLCIVVALVFSYQKMYKQDADIIKYWFALLFLFLVPLFGAIASFKEIVEIKLTPKIYLIQKAEEIIKK